MDEAEQAWEAAAAAYIAFQDRQDPNRTLMLDPIMLEQCGEVRGRRVLDLGCGEGRFCRMLAERGARPVGLDPTGAMVKAAASRGPGGAYLRARAEQLPFADAWFDVVVSYITLVDIEGYRQAIAESSRVLRTGGRLVVANLGFVTASAGWLRDEQGRRMYHRVDRYAEEWPAALEWKDISDHQLAPPAGELHAGVPRGRTDPPRLPRTRSNRQIAP